MAERFPDIACSHRNCQFVAALGHAICDSWGGRSARSAWYVSSMRGCSPTLASASANPWRTLRIADRHVFCVEGQAARRRGAGVEVRVGRRVGVVLIADIVSAAEKILTHLGLQARAPPRSPAHGLALQAA